MHKFYDECAYFTAARYFRKVEKITNKIFEPTGLPPSYAYILLYLEDFPEGSVTKIADDLGYERTTMSRMLKVLLDKDLVEFKIVGRKKIVKLTSQSKDTLEIANECLYQLKLLTDEQLGQNKIHMTKMLTENYWRLKE